MARESSRHVQKYIHVLIVLSLGIVANAVQVKDDSAPEFHSIEDIKVTQNADYKKLLFTVRGRNIDSGLQIKATAKNSTDRFSECEEDLKYHYNFSEVETYEFQWAQYELTVPRDVQGEIYLCLPRKVKDIHGSVLPFFKLNGVYYKWFPQGQDIKLNLTTE